MQLFFGLEIRWSVSGNELRISQHKYVCNVLERFGMNNARSAPTPMEERFRDQLVHSSDTSDFIPRPPIGDILYLAVISLLDIATAVRILAQRNEHPTEIVKQSID